MSIVAELNKLDPTGRLALRYDTLRWTHASKMAKFDGGLWEQHKLPNGKTIDFSTFPVTDGKVRVFNYISGSESFMDQKSAGAALSILALAHTVETFYGNVSDDLADALITLSDETKNGVYDDASLDHRGIYRIID